MDSYVAHQACLISLCCTLPILGINNIEFNQSRFTCYADFNQML